MDESRRQGDVSLPPSVMLLDRAEPMSSSDMVYREQEKEEEVQGTSEILSEIMATWGVKDDAAQRGGGEDDCGGGGGQMRGIKVKGAQGEMTILPFRMPSLTPQRTPTPPPVVFSQFYPPQSLSLESFEMGATLGTPLTPTFNCIH